MTILITGATGAFGRVLGPSLQQRRGEPVCLSGRRAVEGDNYVQCDLTDERAVQLLITSLRPSVIYHLAATYSDDFEESFAVNVRASRFILDALVEHGVTARVVLVGSAAEYGIVTADENPVSEARALRPVSIYGVTKAMQTQLVPYYAHQHGCDVVAARVFNLIAPGLSERLFVGRVAAQLERFKAGEIDAIPLGNLEHFRDFIDAARACEILELIEARGNSGEVYNVGSGRPRQVQDLLSQLLRDAGVDDRVVQRAGRSSHRGYDVPIIYADMTKTLALGELP